MQIQDIKVNEFCNIRFNGRLARCRVVEHRARKNMFSYADMVKVKFVGKNTFDWVSKMTEVEG
jgi:hypothetical protein